MTSQEWYDHLTVFAVSLSYIVTVLVPGVMELVPAVEDASLEAAVRCLLSFAVAPFVFRVMLQALRGYWRVRNK